MGVKRVKFIGNYNINPELNPPLPLPIGDSILCKIII
jgi:hypothetical protein